MTLDDIKHLKEVCAKATPGPWKFYNLLPGGYEVCVDGDYARGGICVPVKKENALYVATFNPQQVAELLELAETDAALDDGWIPVSERLPEQKDKYYLFGGYDSDGEWVTDKYHLDLQGRVNGWGVETLVRLGNTHWRELPPPPKDKSDG